MNEKEYLKEIYKLQEENQKLKSALNGAKIVINDLEKELELKDKRIEELEKAIEMNLEADGIIEKTKEEKQNVTKKM